MRTVVITGIGLVTPLGLTAAENLDRVRTLESAIGPITALAVNGRLCRSSAQVAEFDVTEGLRFPKSTKFMNRAVQCGMQAGLSAIRSSGLEPGQTEPERTAVYTGTGQTALEPGYFMSPLGFAWGEDRERDYKYLGGRASRMIDRYFSLRTLANAGIGLLSNELGAKGPNGNYVHSETASLMALQNAWYDVAEGRADVALAGGYDSLLLPTAHLDYQRAGMLSMSEPCCAYRPFDVKRDGMVPGEGAGFLVLEPRDLAEKRGAPVLAEIEAIECMMESREELLARLLNGIGVDFAVARGLGTREGDCAEYRGIQERLAGVPVTAFKSRTGYLGAATAAVELGLGLLAARCGFLPAIARFQTPDATCSLDLVAMEARPVKRRDARGLFLSASLGGQVAGIVARTVAE